MKTKLTFILFLLSTHIIFSQARNVRTPAEAIHLLKKNITCEWSDQTVDTFKAGNPDTELTGIAVCMFADMETLNKAVQKGCNFIITHEPVFYNHNDHTEAYQADEVFREKYEFIRSHGLVIFRFHDHIHRTQPDGISSGMINKLELNQNAVNGSQTFFKLPETTLAEFAELIKNKLEMESIRIIGKPEMQFTKVAFMAGAPGGQRHIQMLSNNDVEVLIAGEAPEWETYLYANDAVTLNKNKAVIFVGHIKSEEAGMEHCARWLRSFIEGVPIYFIENQPNFKTF
jgi:putative NIF3 family GTP cyclohydrolase 1 type 2